MPDQAREASAEGAAAFVTHYVDLLNYAALTGDVAELEAASGENCEGCGSYIELYRSTYESGGYFIGNEWTPSNFEVRQIGEVVTVFLHVDASIGRYKSSRDSDEAPTSGEDTEMVLEVEMQNEQWVVATLARRIP